MSVLNSHFKSEFILTNGLSTTENNEQLSPPSSWWTPKAVQCFHEPLKIDCILKTSSLSIYQMLLTWELSVVQLEQGASTGHNYQLISVWIWRPTIHNLSTIYCMFLTYCLIYWYKVVLNFWPYHNWEFLSLSSNDY